MSVRCSSHKAKWPLTFCCAAVGLGWLRAAQLVAAGGVSAFGAAAHAEAVQPVWPPAAFCSCPITTLILLCCWRLCDPGWQHRNCQDRHHRRRSQSNLGHLGHQHWHQSWALQVGGGVWRLAMMVPVTRALGPEPWAGGSAVVGGDDCTCTCVVGCGAPGRVCGGRGGGGSCSFCSWSRIKCSSFWIFIQI